MNEKISNACGELIRRVEAICKAARADRLNNAERAKLDTSVWAFALNLSSEYNDRKLAMCDSAVIVSRLASEKGAKVDHQPSPVRSGFDILVDGVGRYDLVGTMKAILNGETAPAKRKEKG